MRHHLVVAAEVLALAAQSTASVGQVNVEPEPGAVGAGLPLGLGWWWFRSEPCTLDLAAGGEEPCHGLIE